jgi:WD40 repeat protein
MRSTAIILLPAFLLAAIIVPGFAAAPSSKVPADADKISAMLRQRFGDSVARNIRVVVENKPEGLRVSLTGEVPDNQTRIAVMNEVESRVDNIKFQDFNLTIGGPVSMLFGFEASVQQDMSTHFAADLSFAVTNMGAVYELATGRRINRIDLQNDRVNATDLSPDGKKLAVAYQSGELTLYDMPTGRNRHILQRAPEAAQRRDFDDVVALAFSADSTQLATISRKKGDLRLWDLSKDSAKQIGSHIPNTQSRSPGDKYCIAISPDSRIIATASFDLTELFLWDIASRSKLDSPKIDRLKPTLLAFSHDGKTIAVGRTTEDKRGICLYDLASKKSRILSLDDDPLLSALAFSPDDKTLAVGYHSNPAVRIWDLASGKVWQTLEEQKAGIPCGLAFSANGAVLAVASPGMTPPSIRLWDVSGRPGAATATATMPKPLTEQPPQDDRLASDIEKKIRATVSPQTIISLKVEVSSDGTIRLTGKVTSNDTKRVAQLLAETYRSSDDVGSRPRRKVRNDLDVAGRQSR